jgi:agmatine/peptidylarginine deiminase
MLQIYYPAEWSPQSCIQITWPHSGTDWADVLEEVTLSYITLSKEILKREKLLIVIPRGYNIKDNFFRMCFQFKGRTVHCSAFFNSIIQDYFLVYPSFS